MLKAHTFTFCKTPTVHITKIKYVVSTTRVCCTLFVCTPVTYQTTVNETQLKYILHRMDTYRM